MDLEWLSSQSIFLLLSKRSTSLEEDQNLLSVPPPPQLVEIAPKSLFYKKDSQKKVSQKRVLKKLSQAIEQQVCRAEIGRSVQV